MYRLVPTRPAFCIRDVCKDVILPSELLFLSRRPGGETRCSIGAIVVVTVAAVAVGLVFMLEDLDGSFSPLVRGCSLG